MATKAILLNDKVLVKKMEHADNTTPGGIIIPDATKKKSYKGKVLAVGPGKVFDTGIVKKMACREGDTIAFSVYAGTEVKVDGEDLLAISEEDVLAILTEKK